jgi:hypothetical protein
MAASAIVLTLYLDRFIPGTANNAPLFVVPIPYIPLTFSIQTIVGSAAIVVAAVIHIVGVGPRGASSATSSRR